MGFFDSWGEDNASVVSRKSHRSHKSRKSSSSHKHSKRDRERDRSGSRSSRERRHSKRQYSTSGLEGLLEDEGDFAKNNESRGSFFNMNNNSARSFFSTGRSSSYYKRSPRTSFMTRAYKKLKRLLRDLAYWAKRHPFKVFMLVIMPLITGGALTALLARFGLRLPANIQRMLGIAAKTAGGAGSIGFMGEAVRMAASKGSGNSGSGGNSSLEDHLGYGGGLHYEKRISEYADYSGDSTSGGGGGFFSSIGKFFS